MSNITFKNMLRNMAPDFGVLTEDASSDIAGLMTPAADPKAKDKEREGIEKNVLNQLDRSTKLDEVDTVTFGLETDDNKIVKVYVNVEQAAEFEKELSAKLGEIDDIEEVLNELSKKFEIVDVEWPDEEKTEEEEDDGEDETGMDSLDPKVYKKDDKTGQGPQKAKREDIVRQDAMEGLSYGERVSRDLTESLSSIEQRLSTPSQLLVYHAILQLGLPEQVMTKSPYRSSIITSIKQTAMDLNKNSPLKQALKSFVKRSFGHSTSPEAGEEDEKEVKKDKPTEKPEAKKVEKKPEAKPEQKPQSLKPAEKKPVIKEDVGDNDSFWTEVGKILEHVSPNENALKRLTNSAPWHRLVSRSQAGLASHYVGSVERKMTDLTKAMPVIATEQLDEAITYSELTAVLEALFKFADPTPDKQFATAVLESSQFTQFTSLAKSTLNQKFGGGARAKLVLLQNFLNTRKEVLGKTIQESAQDKDATWTFEVGEEGALTISHGTHLKIVLDAENVEHLSKGVASKQAVVVKSDDKARFSFSPRGVIMNVKPSGSKEICEMTAEDVKSLLSAIDESVETLEEAVKILAEGKKLTDDQIYKILKSASFGCRIIADDEVLYPGVRYDGPGTAARYAEAWKKDAGALEKKLKADEFYEIEIKEFDSKNGPRGSWVTAKPTIIT